MTILRSCLERTLIRFGKVTRLGIPEDIIRENEYDFDVIFVEISIYCIVFVECFHVYLVILNYPWRAMISIVFVTCVLKICDSTCNLGFLLLSIRQLHWKIDNDSTVTSSRKMPEWVR